jgi:hypothetical protein
METVTVHQKGEDFEITVQHDQSGSAYGITLSKNAYEQLRQHFVSGSLHPDIEKLIRYTIKQWTSLNEQREPDHEVLVNHWLNSDLKEWFGSAYR